MSSIPDREPILRRRLGGREMKRKLGTVLPLTLILVLAVSAASLQGRGDSPDRQREKARQLYDEGNYRDAQEIFEDLVFHPDNSPLLVGGDMEMAVSCLQNLNRDHETDGLRERAAETHAGNWRFLWRLAESWYAANHYGFIVAGEFHRGGHRGGGRAVNSFERDRVRALQLMERAMGESEGEPVAAALGEFHFRLAQMVMGYRGHQGSWRLQYLTDLTSLPDYAEGYGAPWSGESPGAPVHPDGTPVYHGLPETWESAASDGERWRWLLRRTALLDRGKESQVMMDFASFLHQQFGVQTLGGYGGLFGGRGVETPGEPGAYALHTLRENETIARLAGGVQRFELPEEFDYLRVLRGLADRRDAYSEQALNRLAQIFENRRQYDEAALLWRRSIAEHGDSNQGWKGRRIGQIVDPWGEFEPAGTHPAGKAPSLEYRFRNGRSVSFSARRIRVARLLADVKAYLRSNPRKLDRDRMNISQIGYRLIRENENKYVGSETASWNLDVDPPAGHFDRRVTVKTPLEKAGAYLLTADLEEGNRSRIVVWVSDTVIVRKHLDGGNLFFIADAVSGDPLPDVKVDFFGYDQERTDWQKVIGRRHNIVTKEFSYRADGEGLLVPNPGDFTGSHRWLITAATENGRLAYLGWSGVWTGRRYDSEYRERKVYTVTDRPVYRPDQEVKFKLWVRHAQYDQEGRSRYAGRDFTVRIDNPRNEKVFEKSFRADDWGGVNGAFALPGDAVLGVYRISIPGTGGSTFRVEEYKKPEFEVTLDAPERPVMLGETIETTIRADYYFGAPVTSARVKYKVLRTAHTARWYPPGLWDWFYGPGYWWFGYDYPWYPGWRSWGLERPARWWWPVSPLPPEVVAQAEVPIGEDGTVAVIIDTSFAKEVYGDTDHRYEIVAEVTDRSRRTIVGRGEVLVARQPFKVTAWVDRGHYRGGDIVKAEFSARTLDGSPVKGDGELLLKRISYDEGEPVEAIVQRWAIGTDDEGSARVQIEASRPGQYRLSYSVTDAGGRTVEGGYIFTVRGRGEVSGDFRFNSIEILPDRKEYAPGEKVRLMVNREQGSGTVLLFLRPANGVYLAPKVLRLSGKSVVEELTVTKKDMPNFFVEALTVSGGRVYTETREIVVPPEKRVLNVEVLPSAERYRPGEKAKVKVRVTDFAGKPFPGSAVLSAYDRSVEYVSGGSNVPEIRAFFWKWRRRHQPRTESSLDRRFGNVVKSGEATMQPLGVFGHLVADDLDDGAFGDSYREGERMEVKQKAMLRAPAASNMMVGKEMVMEESSPRMGSAADAAAGPAGEDRSAGDVAEPAVRSEFADTAFWDPSLVTDDEGVVEVEFDMPDNLTDWKMRAWVMGHGTVVGEGTAGSVTAKDLILRLQAPRFFVEKDEVLLSANIHNYLSTAKEVRAVLELEGGSLEAMEGAVKEVMVPAGGEERVDWRVKVLREGEAVVRMKALTDEESDAVEMAFPVYVHGMLKTESVSGVVRPEKPSSAFSFNVPAERRIDQSRLEIRYTPTLAGAMVDALPYLVEYPYGCTEQTLNRFLPTVITQRILLEMDLDLEAIRDKQTNLNAQEIGKDVDRAGQWRRWKRNPVFDVKRVEEMAAQGVRRLAAMQLSDGGWGWFSGWGEHSTPHTTATVVHGLQAALANGADLLPGMMERGVSWLEDYQAGELRKLRNAEEEKKPWKRRADNLDALVQMVLADAGRADGAMTDYLYRDRTDLSVYALAMFGMALHGMERTAELEMVMSNIEQFLVEDPENQTAWLELPGGRWWYWYGSEYEAQAYYLKLLARTDPKSSKAAGLVKYLLNNRRHATYWNSTRDTALCIEAMADYLRASGEDRPDMTVEIFVDGVRKKEVRITPDNLFSFDNSLVLEGRSLTSGEHSVEVRRRGKGPVYFNAYLTNFTLEDFITGAGLEIKVERKYYRLREIDKSIKASGARGQVLDRKVEKYEREELGNHALLRSGELVEIELVIESKNDYEYIVFEDMKAAGFEPVEVRSGYGGNDLGAYMELRDERVVFFVRALARGRHSVAYRMRAEIPGTFSALPTRASAMYAPELKANSDEIKLRITD
jgi:uncharacterized protein YfaS (alpha-2-macroglobulin family)